MILRDTLEILKPVRSVTSQGTRETSWISYDPPITTKCEFMVMGGRIKPADYGITDATVRSLVFVKNRSDLINNHQVKVTANIQGVLDIFYIYLIKPYKTHFEVFLKPVVSESVVIPSGE